MRTFRIFLLGAAGLVLATTAQAQSNIIRSHAASATTPTRTYGSVTPADLRAIVLAEGHTVDKINAEGVDTPNVRGKTKDGKKFLLIGTACDKNGIPGCRGIMMQVRYDSDDRVTTAGVNDSNLHEAALNTWWDQEGKTVGFTRYVVLDDGVTMLNLRQNLRVLLNVSATAQKYVFP